MTVEFGYNKAQVIQALRYHFISKKELRLMIILVNVFAIFSLVLYLFGKITPIAFIINSLLWIVLMISIWFILPGVVYRRAQTFQHHFTMYFNEDDFTLEHDKGRRNWPYTALKTFKETPNFFHLYFDERSFLLVPKDGFKTIEDIAALRNLLRQKLQ
ncbi:MAG: YcxB family protein [Niabella sp.]